MGAQVSHLWGRDRGRLSPNLHLPHSDMGWGEMPSPFLPIYQSGGAGGRAGPVVIRSRELSPAPTSCNTLENRPCTPPEQLNRAHPISGGVGEPALKWAWYRCYGGIRRGELPSPITYQCLKHGRRAGPVVIRRGAPSLTPTICNSLESRPCPPGQHNRANPVSGGLDEPGRAVPISHLTNQPDSCSGPDLGLWLGLS